METPKKPNIKVPEGNELYFNYATNHWALRLISGYKFPKPKAKKSEPKNAAFPTEIAKPEEETNFDDFFEIAM